MADAQEKSPNWETRREPRIRVTAKAQIRINPTMQETVHLAKDQIDARLVDISLHGVGFISSVFLPVGVTLDLDLYKTSLENPDAPLEGPFRVTGEVVYARPLGKECRIGMRITQMDEVVNQFLQKFISLEERRQNPRIPFQ